MQYKFHISSKHIYPTVYQYDFFIKKSDVFGDFLWFEGEKRLQRGLKTEKDRQKAVFPMLEVSNFYNFTSRIV